MPIHPKTSGAAVGSALGIVIVGILHSIHGIDLAPELYAAIPAFLSTLGAWLIPSPAPPASPVESVSAPITTGGGPPL